MLTSSDAKWRCLWHMLVWSINLTLVSQFLELTNHIAFYLFGTISVLILPVLTSVYSNTSGRHGSGLLRAGYVFCDPVVSCVTISPVLLVNHLPALVSEYYCYKLEDWNATYQCLWNVTSSSELLPDTPVPPDREAMLAEKKREFQIIEVSIVVPILLSLLMGKRTRKMNLNTHLLNFAYWFVVAIEAADLMEKALLGRQFQHTVYTSEAIVAIAMIITNSYAVITLCSYVTPATSSGQGFNRKRFDFLYKVFIGISGIFFSEIPLLVARVNILAADEQHILPGTFYFWMIKNVLAIGILITMVLVQKFSQKYMKIPCKTPFDGGEVFFQPEKRDVYIVKQKKVRFQDPPATEFKEKVPSAGTAVPKNDNIELTRVHTETEKADTSQSLHGLKKTPDVRPKVFPNKQKTKQFVVTDKERESFEDIDQDVYKAPQSPLPLI